MSVFVDTMRSLLQNGSGRGRIEQCCTQLSWSIDEREGDKLKLHFNDKVVGIRKLYISHGDDPLVLFMAYSHAVVPASRLPDELPKYLVTRNCDLSIGKWQMPVDDEGDALFVLHYCALGEGVNAAALKYIAQSLITEASDFDAKMVRAGLLRV